jgi:hypothetical protein
MKVNQLTNSILGPVKYFSFRPYGDHKTHSIKFNSLAYNREQTLIAKKLHRITNSLQNKVVLKAK